MTRPAGHPRYAPGQPVRAAELSADVAAAGRDAGWHVRGLHGTWGIAAGLRVSVAGLRVVGVASGAAFDVYGRPAVVAAPVLVPLPQLPLAAAGSTWWADLVLRPPDPRPRWSVAGPALPGEPAPGHGGDVMLGLDLPLARLAVTASAAGTTVTGSADTSLCRYARGEVRPRIVTDRVPKGAGSATGLTGCWSVEVDTSAAGFSSVPRYFASLAGDPLADVAATGTDTGTILGPFLSVTQPSARGFVLSVRFGSPVGAAVPAAFSFTVDGAPVPVEWVGVEGGT